MLFDPGCSNCGCPSSGVPCGTCSLPASNLTLTITNSLLGTFVVPLIFNGTNEWASACSNQILYSLRCTSGVMTFNAAYFAGGHCPTGTPVICSSGGGSPFGLPLVAQTCDPLFLDFRTTSCTSLNIQGYTRFVVTL